MWPSAWRRARTIISRWGVILCPACRSRSAVSSSQLTDQVYRHSDLRRPDLSSDGRIGAIVKRFESRCAKQSRRDNVRDANSAPGGQVGDGGGAGLDRRDLAAAFHDYGTWLSVVATGHRSQRAWESSAVWLAGVRPR